MDSVVLVIDKDGKASLYEEPYAVIECKTEEDYNYLVSVMEKQNKEAVIDNGYGVKFCPICKGSVWQIEHESNYCFRCGQKLKRWK